MFDLVPFRRQNKKVVENDDPFAYLFSNFFNDALDVASVSFKTDVKENENEYIVQAELPGVEKEDINLELDDNYLTISVNNKEEHTEKKENYIRRERRTGSFQRAFYMENVKEDEIKAKYNDGILEIKLPKENPGKSDRKIIDIE